MRFAPPVASTMADQIDGLFWFLIGLSAFFVVLISAAIVFLCVRYRAGAKVDRSNPPPMNVPLEAVWIGIPVLIVLGIFARASQLFIRLRRPPPDAVQVLVVGRQWMWKMQHSTGRAEINELHVPLGRPTKLLMTSQDVIHSFFVPAFRVKQDVLPGRYTTLWFTPTRTGEFHLFCTQYCGTAHSQMIGRIVVMRPADFEKWLAAGRMPGAPQEEDPGRVLFREKGCVTCHRKVDGQGPPLEDIFGKTVFLSDGKTVVADEDYLRRSILYPAAQVVAGYPNIMPSFKGQLTEPELAQLISYLERYGTGRQQEPRR